MEFPSISNGIDQEKIIFDLADVDFDIGQLLAHKDWLTQVASNENRDIVSLSYILCSDQYLHRINVDYLDHDTLTDIITFELGNPQDENIEGEIYISIDRVLDNAKQLSVDFIVELSRVLVHGLLHLIGYPDKNSKEKEAMRGKEDHYLALLERMS